MTIYVNMVDRFMSGWGMAPHTARFSIKCDTIAQAEAIARAARDRSEMRYVNISDRPARKRSAGDHVRIFAFAELSGSWLRYATT